MHRCTNTTLRLHRPGRNSICLKFINETELCPTLPLWGNLISSRFNGSASEVLKYFPSIFLCFPTNSAKCRYIDTLFSRCATRWNDPLKHINYYHACLLVVVIKAPGNVVLLLVKIGSVWKGTRPKFIDSRNFYFHFHCKPFSTKAFYWSFNLPLVIDQITQIHRSKSKYMKEDIIKMLEFLVNNIFVNFAG